MTAPVVVGGTPTDEEVAAIVAAVSALAAQRRAHAVPPAAAITGWVGASRLMARREPMQRGAWRMSGRIQRRHRA
ncbi:MAG: acyl-CoA carboxylase epsilon subunit [Acidimicrobiia bacterium]